MAVDALVASESQDGEPRTPPSALSAKQACIYHSRRTRGVYQQLMNAMRTDSVIPIPLLSKVAGLICTCNMFKFQEDFDDSMKMECWKISSQDIYKDVITRCRYSKLHKMKAAVHALTRIKSLEADDKYQLGCRRLVYVLLKAMQDEYEHLKYKRDDNVSEFKDNEQIKHISEFEIDFVPAYVSFLFGTNGKNIKQFAKLHNCQLKVLGNTHPHRFHTDSTTMVFKLAYSKLDQGAVIKDALQKLMKEITKKREQQNKRVLDYWEARRKKAEARKNRQDARAFKMGNNGRGTNSAYVAACEVKNSARDNYSTKYQHMLKDKITKRSEKRSPRPSVLEEGLAMCANCYLPYSKDGVGCVYHQGFVKTTTRYTKRQKKVFYEWSCCGVNLGESCPSFTDRQTSHKDSGCVKVTQHVWKPHKKSAPSKHSGKQPLMAELAPE